MSGQRGNASNQLDGPRGLYIDWSNTLYIADRWNNRIQKYLRDATFGETVAGDPTGVSGSGSSFLSEPVDLTVDLNNHIYVSDGANHRVQLWNQSSSTGITIAGITGSWGNASNQLYRPVGIYHDSVKNGLYIAERPNNRIMYYSIGVTTGTIAIGGNAAGLNDTQLNGPVGICFDEISNSILIANADANNVVRWTVGASNWTLAAGDRNGASGTASDKLQNPGDVILDPMGNMYVADQNNHRVQLFLLDQSNGITIAGITGIAGSNASLFNASIAIVLDNQLNLYVSDYWNQRVQKFLRY